MVKDLRAESDTESLEYDFDAEMSVFASSHDNDDDE